MTSGVVHATLEGNEAPGLMDKLVVAFHALEDLITEPARFGIDARPYDPCKCVCSPLTAKPLGGLGQLHWNSPESALHKRGVQETAGRAVDAAGFDGIGVERDRARDDTAKVALAQDLRPRQMDRPAEFGLRKAQRRLRDVVHQGGLNSGRRW